ncbi:MAG: formate dehydrogenase accessory protein FdhE [Deltaproteobacteria bacterium]
MSAWIERHPYLRSLAALHDAVEGQGAARRRQDPRSAEEIARGVPLLKSRSLDPGVFVEAGTILASTAQALLRTQLPPQLLEECGALCAQLEDDPAFAVRLVRSVAEMSVAPSSLETFLAWKALGRALGPSERTEGWTRNCCPCCGTLPAMALLRESDRGRERALSCGLCGTRWTYARIGCPYCRSDELQQLGVLEPEDDEGFRIDVCGHCDAYLKTYVGKGEEALALADWSTLHLDAACRERGLRRAGPSLYEF